MVSNKSTVIKRDCRRYMETQSEHVSRIMIKSKQISKAIMYSFFLLKYFTNQTRNVRVT
jgi:hypothetical protein